MFADSAFRGKGLIRDEDIILGLQGLKEEIVSSKPGIDSKPKPKYMRRVSDVIRAGPICQDWQRKKRGRAAQAAGASILDFSLQGSKNDSDTHVAICDSVLWQPALTTSLTLALLLRYLKLAL